MIELKKGFYLVTADGINTMLRWDGEDWVDMRGIRPCFTEVVQTRYCGENNPVFERDEPVALVTGVYGGRFTYAPIKASVVLPVGMALYTHPQPKAKQEPTSGFFSREAMKEHSDFHPQTKAGQGEPVFHLRQYGDVTKEQLDRYIATGRIDTRPQPKQEQDEPATLEEIRKAMIFGIPLYTTPQHREWVDLTGEELETLLRENRSLTLGAIWAVADKLKEKNT